MIVASDSLALTGADAVWDMGAAILAGATFVPGSNWPTRLIVVSSTGVAASVALEYVNSGLQSPTSTYDGIATGSALTSATMSGAYLLDPTSGYSVTIYVKPQAVQMKMNLKVHVFGASGTALISAERQ